MKKAIGLDACQSGWICAIIVPDGTVAVEFHATIEEVLSTHPEATAFAIDMPIGLAKGGKREADEAARLALGGGAVNHYAASRVFNAPPTSVLDTVTYVQARQQVPGLAAQSWALIPKIKEVAAVVGGAATRGVDIREAHPEVIFRFLEGRALPGKKTWNGLMRRVEILTRKCGLELDTYLAKAGTFDPDDVVDAIACAWTARRIANGWACSLPVRPQKIAGRDVAIWY